MTKPWVHKKIRKFVNAMKCPTCKAKIGNPCVNLKFFSPQKINDDLVETQLETGRKRRASYKNYVHGARRPGMRVTTGKGPGRPIVRNLSKEKQHG